MGGDGNIRGRRSKEVGRSKRWDAVNSAAEGVVLNAQENFSLLS